MRSRLALILGKFVAITSKTLGLGAGATWPGEIALTISPNILSNLVQNLKEGVVIVAGTNGKTTTSLMIKKILEIEGQKIIHNTTGANLLNGVVSSFVKETDFLGNVKADFGVFEVDENSLPIVLSQTKSKKLTIVLLNLFRDQLDRYGEVDVIAEKWTKALQKLPSGTTVILNSDDPQVAHLGKSLSNVKYFGLNDSAHFLKNKEHATDSTFCLNCGGRLHYEGIYYSHIGVWNCEKCGEKRPEPDFFEWNSPLPGLYNKYNTLAAVSAAKTLEIKDEIINKALSTFTPAFGRQEEFEVNEKKVKIFLSKNPAGFNASLRTVLELNPKTMLLVLNDRIPDGRDVSWIWDVDFEMISQNISLITSGDRAYDMAIRIKYADTKNVLITEEYLNKAINTALEKVDAGETVFVLATYSAMLEVRKVLSGRKIL